MLSTAHMLPSWQPDTIEFQGDNRAVIGAWNGTCRFHGQKLNSLLDEARRVARYQLGSPVWTFVPRERNITADKLAGKASRWLESVMSIFRHDPAEDHQGSPHSANPAHEGEASLQFSLMDEQWIVPNGSLAQATGPSPLLLAAALAHPQAVPIQCWERVDDIDWDSLPS